MKKTAISKDGKYQISHGPHIFYKQMVYFDEMKDEMLDSINRHIDNSKLKLNMNELFLKNEYTFFSRFNRFESRNPKYPYIASFGNYALRFNICLDNILILLGHEYLIKSGAYDKFQSTQYDGHPLIMNFGPKCNSEYLINTICLDENALYSFRLKNTPYEPIIIDDFINESEFIKEIIKRSLSGYFYKDQNSCGCFQAIHRNPTGSIDATILIYLFNYLSMLDNFCHLINYIYDLNIIEVTEIEQNSRVRINWGNINIITKELKKKGKYADLLSGIIDNYSKSLNRGTMKFAHIRNVVMHEGNVLVFSEKNGKKGVFICTDNDPENILRPDMSAVFDAIPFVLKSYALLLKIFNEFYGLLFNSVNNGETVFNTIQKGREER